MSCLHRSLPLLSLAGCPGNFARKKESLFRFQMMSSRSSKDAACHAMHRTVKTRVNSSWNRFPI